MSSKLCFIYKWGVRVCVLWVGQLVLIFNHIHISYSYGKELFCDNELLRDMIRSSYRCTFQWFYPMICIIIVISIYICFKAFKFEKSMKFCCLVKTSIIIANCVGGKSYFLYAPIHINCHCKNIQVMWWCLKTIYSNSSFSSNANTVFTFQQLFPDLEIGKKIQLSQTKSMYLSCFSISPIFSSLLESQFRGLP